MHFNVFFISHLYGTDNIEITITVTKNIIKILYEYRISRGSFKNIHDDKLIITGQCNK